MLADAEALRDALLGGTEGGGPATGHGTLSVSATTPATGPDSRLVTLEPMDGGHDWAWWRAGLLSKLAELLGE